MNRKMMLVFFSLVLFICVPSVQASQKVHKLNWESLIEQAHNIQAKYSSESVEYTTVRNDFLKVFTRETMMTIFMEHIIIQDELYSLASTDFSPYIIPSLEWTSFHVEESSEDKVVLLEDKREPTELSGPQQILRKITLTHEKNGWRISNLDWEVTEASPKG